MGNNNNNNNNDEKTTAATAFAAHTIKSDKNPLTYWIPSFVQQKKNEMLYIYVNKTNYSHVFWFI